MLSSTVTGGTWPTDITYQRVMQEKGVGFTPGGEIPDSVGTTAWSFMGQEIPQNCGNLVFDCPCLHVKTLTQILNQSRTSIRKPLPEGGT